jgi:hypothetical protein
LAVSFHQCHLPEGQRSKAGNLPKINTLLEIWEYWIEKYFQLKLFIQSALKEMQK